MKPAESPKSSWQEAFQGKDVVWGKEIVTSLVYEGIGMLVYNRNLVKRKQMFQLTMRLVGKTTL